jgi:hypothetical protein
MEKKINDRGGKWLTGFINLSASPELSFFAVINTLSESLL